VTPVSAPIEGVAAPESAYALAAVAIRARHDIDTGLPEPAPVWRKLSAILPWLDRARRHCIEPPPHAAKASEWLLDNEFQVRRAIRQVREDLPTAFYRRLPRLAALEYRGIPRVMALAQGMLDVAHMQVSLAGALDFVKAYQQDEPLTIAELWAFPSMLRLACLEALVQSFSELLPELTPPFEPTPRLTRHETLDPTEGVSRAISALVAVSNTSWKAFFEQVSRVEAVLQDDPAGVYPAMDFDTRDRYRKAVEEIADGAQATEWEVAEAALKLSRAHAGARRFGHVGCWLASAPNGMPPFAAGSSLMPAQAMLGHLQPSPLGRWPCLHCCSPCSTLARGRG
jgi:cyclic beta-1,2-glucan synthetase